MKTAESLVVTMAAQTDLWKADRMAGMTAATSVASMVDSRAGQWVAMTVVDWVDALVAQSAD